MRGAWIEIRRCQILHRNIGGSHPVRGAWIEIAQMLSAMASAMSHPVRGAWIEIPIAVRYVARASSRTP